MTAPAIDLYDVAKTYPGRVHALLGIAMQVGAGEIFGLLGPNGAGKSTLVKIVMTVIRPTRAGGLVLGRPVGHKPTLARIGYLPEQPRFPSYLTGRQVLDYFAALAKVDRGTRKRRGGELLEQLGLADRADAKAKTYSKGMQQRLGLAQALMNNPDLVVLDEPTDGLDPVGRRDVRELILRLRNQGKTVFLNSHLLGEVERVCNRVAILVGGRVVKQGTVEELTDGSRGYEIEVADNSPIDRATLPFNVPAEVVGSIIRLGTADPAAIQPVIDALRSRSTVIRAVRPVRASLEDLFMQAIAGRGADSIVACGTKGERP